MGQHSAERLEDRLLLASDFGDALQTSLATEIVGNTKIAHELNGGPTLTDNDRFGASVASLGDVDGDGIGDIAVGTTGRPLSNSSGSAGFVYVQFLNANGTVRESVPIGEGLNGGPVISKVFRAFSLASLGDLDGNGVTDLIVGTSGSVVVLFLNSDGTVGNSVEIGDELNGGPDLEGLSFFGNSVASLGDIDGDGVADIAVGDRQQNTTYILFLNADGTARKSAKIASDVGGLPAFSDIFFFGSGVASPGDLDGDGVADLAVTSTESGASLKHLFVLLLNADGTVKASSETSNQTLGHLAGHSDILGDNISAVGDVNGDGIGDLAWTCVELAFIPGEQIFPEVGIGFYFLTMNSNGTIRSYTRVANGAKGHPTAAQFDDFGSSVAALGDFNVDGLPDLAVGVSAEDTGGMERGAVWILNMQGLAVPAADLVVDVLHDESDGNLAVGDLSLREAIELANASASHRTISFDPVVFNVAQTIPLTLGEIEVSGQMTIIGTGRDLLTIDAQDNTRIFKVLSGTELTIDGLTLTGGNAGTGVGGAFLIDASSVQLINTRISGNRAEYGGAIFNSSAQGVSTLKIRDSIVEDNVANDWRGAIYNWSDDSVFGPAATVIIEGSTVAGNQANADGGAFVNRWQHARLTLINSTVSGNMAGSSGGGIRNGNAGSVLISSATITDNESNGAGPGVYHISGTFRANNSLIAGNHRMDGTPHDVSGAFNNQSVGNLLGVSSGATGISDGVNGNIVGTSVSPVDPKVGPLQDNGGSTPTHALLAGSRAIDGGLNAQAAFLLTDQRSGSFDRFIDGNGIGSAVVDIGAYEYKPAPDLLATEFYVAPHHVLDGQADVTFTVRNQGAIAANAFDVSFVWSLNGSLGDPDDVVVRTESVAGLAPAATMTLTSSITLNKADLFAHAVNTTPAGQAVGTVSGDTSHLFLVIDDQNVVAEAREDNNSGQGNLIDSDSITYFPWDKNGNGTVEPLEALGSIQSIGTASAESDFNGDGIVTPLEALSAIQRIGYVGNSSVTGVAPSIPLLPNVTVPLLQSAAVSAVAAEPVLAEDSVALSTEMSPKAAPPVVEAGVFMVWPDDRDDKNDLFLNNDEPQELRVPVSADNPELPDGRFWEATDWLSAI